MNNLGTWLESLEVVYYLCAIIHMIYLAIKAYQKKWFEVKDKKYVVVATLNVVALFLLFGGIYLLFEGNAAGLVLVVISLFLNYGLFIFEDETKKGDILMLIVFTSGTIGMVAFEQISNVAENQLRIIKVQEGVIQGQRLIMEKLFKSTEKGIPEE